MKRIMFVLMVLLLAGCRPGTSYDIDFHKGTSGLELSFIDNMPPKEVYEGSDFQLGVEVKNNGAFDVTDGLLFISSYDKDYNKIRNDREAIELKGKSQYLPTGEREVKEFTVKNIGMPTHEDFTTMFVATACYRYETHASPVVCVNPDIYQKSQICKAETITLSGGQGAPIAVTKVEQGIIPKENDIELTFKIYLKNVGKGYVRSEQSYRKDCSSSLSDFLTDFDMDKVTIEAELSGRNLDCLRGEKPIDISQQDSYVLCSLRMPKGEKAYTTPLKITISYGYVDVLVKDIKVKRRPG